MLKYIVLINGANKTVINSCHSNDSDTEYDMFKNKSYIILKTLSYDILKLVLIIINLVLNTRLIIK